MTVQFCNLGLASCKIGSPNTRAGLGRAGAPLTYILCTVLNALREIFPRKLERAGKSGALTWCSKDGDYKSVICDERLKHVAGMCPLKWSQHCKLCSTLPGKYIPFVAATDRVGEKSNRFSYVPGGEANFNANSLLAQNVWKVCMVGRSMHSPVHLQTLLNILCKASLWNTAETASQFCGIAATELLPFWPI